ncbi:hypothetical protein AN642_03135 [Epulopiscium sp. SCG-B10WGA-EpuloA2]|nr:hypothetical protein AN642_03135 [Epulopiscium sp. SCG-B10WGA-EpuloA2]
MLNTVAFVSLGCDKNLVDSEHMLGLLNKDGFSLIGDENKAEVLIVNTCCFIEDAKKESIEQILEVAKYKHTGNFSFVFSILLYIIFINSKFLSYFNNW